MRTAARRPPTTAITTSRPIIRNVRECMVIMGASSAPFDGTAVRRAGTLRAGDASVLQCPSHQVDRLGRRHAQRGDPVGVLLRGLAGGPADAVSADEAAGP